MGFMDSLKRFLSLGGPDEELEEGVSSDEESSDSRAKTMRPRANLVSLPAPKRTEIVVMEPSTFADARDVADQLRQKRSLIVNLKRTDRELAARMIDFLSGVSYALDAHIQRVEEQIFLCAPSHVDVQVSSPKASTEQRGDLF